MNDVYSLESLPRLKTLVKQHKRDGTRTLVVLAGDFTAPSLLSSLDAGRGMVDCLNDLGVTHVVLGNHEDDIPRAELHARIAQLEGVWLSSNVAFDPRMKTRDIIEVDDLRVGLLGVVMTDPTVYRDVLFGGAPTEQANDVVVREAGKLLAEGCTCVVPITHQPIEDNRALARRLTPPAPVIVGGHEHTPFLEQVGSTWIVKAGSDATGAVITAPLGGRQVPLGYGQARADVGLRRGPRASRPCQRPHVEGSRESSTRASSSFRQVRRSRRWAPAGRRPPSARFFATPSAIRSARTTASSTAEEIRGARDYTQRFTYADLETEVPFDNEIVVVHMPGHVVRQAILASRSHAPAESGAFLQTDDTLDLEKLEDPREYRVAIVRNLLVGIDHIEPLVRFAAEHPERIPPPGSGRDVKHVLVDAFAVALWRKLGKFDARSTSTTMG